MIHCLLFCYFLRSRLWRLDHAQQRRPQRSQRRHPHLVSHARPCRRAVVNGHTRWQRSTAAPVEADGSGTSFKSVFPQKVPCRWTSVEHRRWNRAEPPVHGAAPQSPFRRDTGQHMARRDEKRVWRIGNDDYIILSEERRAGAKRKQAWAIKN